MPIPTPRPTEKKKDFIQRCMSDEIMTTEYTDVQQRMAICQVQFSEHMLDGYETIMNINKIKEDDGVVI